MSRCKVAALVLLAAQVSSCSAHHDSRRAVPELASALILVSLDGFRWDYLDPETTPNLLALARRGVRAEGLVPVYPSSTFPSHYSMVTGLYPGQHGIFANDMWDPETDREFHVRDREAVTDRWWWGGTPIWVAARRAGLRTATMFWPGSEGIEGMEPNEWHAFDKAFRFEERVAKVLEWMDRPPETRPRFVTLYFEEPNESGHRYGPDAPETRAAVRRVDARVGQLVAGLEARGIADRTDLVIVSDHGMAAVGAERTIYLDDYVEFLPGEVFDQGAVVQIFPRPGREDLIYEALDGAHPRLAVYRRDEIPERYHLRGSSRTPPILGVLPAGWEAWLRAGAVGWTDHLKGDHGQDPASTDLHGLFVAAGPSFRRGLVVERFVNVEVYNVLAAALGLEPGPNEGEPGLADRLMRPGEAPRAKPPFDGD